MKTLLLLLLGLASAPLFAGPAPLEAPLPAGAHVTVNGARLFYWTEGHGEPLLLVEGGPGAAGYLDPFFHELADRFTVIHFRGLGRAGSDPAPKPSDYSFARDVADLEGFRRALGLESFNLLGHSYGGLLVIGYTLEHPSAVKRLVVANGLFSADGWQQGNDNIASQLRYQYPEVWAELEALRARGLHSSSPECQALMQQVSEAVFYVASQQNVGRTPVEFNPDVYYAIAGDDADVRVGGSIAGLDFSARLRELKMPLLVTTSRFDRVVPPSHTFQFQTCAPQAQFVVFEHSGHNVFLEEHEKFIATIRDFLTKPLPATP
jgi:proline iminopeptidase